MLANSLLPTKRLDFTTNISTRYFSLHQGNGHYIECPTKNVPPRVFANSVWILYNYRKFRKGCSEPNCVLL